MHIFRTFLFLAALFSVAALPSAQAPDPGRGVSRVMALTAETASPLCEWDLRLDAMARSGEVVRRTTRADTVLAGRAHERFDQYVHGIRVFGGDAARQTRNSVTESIFGTLHAGVAIDPVPGLSEDEARARFAALSARELPPDRPIELVVLPLDEGGYALAWSTHVWTDEGWMHTFIDAHDGSVRLQYNDLQTQAVVGTGTGVLGDTKKISTTLMGGRYVADDRLRPPVIVTYDMRGNPFRVLAYIEGLYRPTVSDIASDGDNRWVDAANVDAHVHLGWTYDYYFKRFGRRGLDDRDAPVYALTHPVRRSDVLSLPSVFRIFVDNAFWCGACGPDGRGVMVFGEGLPPGYVFTDTGKEVDYVAGALDVVAHELTHALTSHSSRLLGRNEPGALDESFSDILGTSVEFFYGASGDGAAHADYLIGEDVFRPGGIRSMSNPRAFGHPDHYSRRFRGTQDDGGVHINSSIPNHAFYLAIEGGVNRTSGLRVTGVGAANREQIEQAFYRAFTYMLPSSATFSTARAATILSARELYGAGSPAERAIREAWIAVGVN